MTCDVHCIMIQPFDRVENSMMKACMEGFSTRGQPKLRWFGNYYSIDCLSARHARQRAFDNIASLLHADCRDKAATA